MRPSTQKIAFLTLFLVIFLDLLGVGIIIPILTPLILDPETALIPSSWTDGARTTTLGLLLSIYPLAQFFGAPILGKLSDAQGRKRILSISILGTALGYTLFGIGILTDQLWLLFFSRALDGFTGGNVAVAFSAIADLSPKPQERAKNFGMIGMAFGLGLMAGPALGGLLSDPSVHPTFNMATPFFFVTGMALLNCALVIWKLPETLKLSLVTKLKLLIGLQNIHKAFRMKELRVLFFLVFLHSFGFFFFADLFPTYLVKKFDFTPAQIGLFFTYVGLWIAISQGGLNRLALRFADSKRIVAFALPMLSLSLVIMLIPQIPVWLLLTQPLVAIAEGLVFPNITNLISQHASEEEQGEVMGIAASMRSLATALAPAFAGIAVSFGIGIPNLSAAVVLAIAYLIYLFFVLKKSGFQY